MVDQRRQGQRVRLQYTLKHRPATGLTAMWRNGALTDLSASGLRFTADQLLEQDDELELQIAFPSQKEPSLLSTKVMWGKEIASGLREYGVTFIGLTPDQQATLDELVQFLLKGRAKA